MTYLTQGWSLASRFIFWSMFIVIMFMVVIILIAKNDEIVQEMRREFAVFREDHREMREIMMRDMQSFSRTVDRNTEQAKRNSEVVKKTAEAVRNLDEKP